jgi:hypothetical protein
VRAQTRCLVDFTVIEWYPIAILWIDGGQIDRIWVLLVLRPIHQATPQPVLAGRVTFWGVAAMAATAAVGALFGHSLM